MKKKLFYILGLFLMIMGLFFVGACSNNESSDDSSTKNKIEINYNNMSTFEDDCKQFFSRMKGIVIEFTIKEIKNIDFSEAAQEKTTYYNLIPQNTQRINVLFEEKPSAKAGDLIIVKITNTMTLLGSYCVTGDILGINVKAEDKYLKSPEFSGSSTNIPSTTDPEQTTNPDSEQTTNPDTIKTNFTYGETFTMSGLQVTVGERFEITEILSDYSDNKGKEAVKIGFDFKNNSNKTINLYYLLWDVFNPTKQVDEETWEEGRVNYDDKLKPNETCTRFIYIPYSNDGVYKIVFSDSMLDDTSPNITVSLSVSQSEGIYKVKWINYDGELLESDDVQYGVKPTYDGETPRKEKSAQYTYVFKGWSPSVTKVTKNVTYTAQYNEITNIYSYADEVTFDGFLYTMPSNAEMFKVTDPYSMYKDMKIIKFDMNFKNITNKSRDLNTLSCEIYSPSGESYYINMEFDNYITIDDDNVPSGETINRIIYTPYTKDGTYRVIFYDEMYESSITAEFTINITDLMETATYNIEHYKQKLDGEYLLIDTEYENGVVGDYTDAKPKSFDGFTTKNFSQVIINSTTSIVKIYYLRNEYNLQISINDEKGGKCTGEGKYKFEQEVSITAERNNGYYFSGWYLNDEFISNESDYKFNMKSNDMQYVAKFTRNPYELSFVPNGGIIENVDFCRVTYDYNYVGGQIKYVDLGFGEKLDYPKTPDRNNYYFSGWYLEPECKNIYLFDNVISGDFTLYAKWVPLEDSHVSYAVGLNVVGITSDNFMAYQPTATGALNWDYLYIKINETGKHKIYYRCGTNSTTAATSSEWTKRIKFKVYNLTQKKDIKTSNNLEENTDDGSFKCVSFTASAEDIIYIAVNDFYGKGAYVHFYTEGFNDFVSTAKTVSDLNYSMFMNYGDNILYPLITRDGYTFTGWYSNDVLYDSATFDLKEKLTLEAKWEPNKYFVTVSNTTDLEINSIDSEISCGETVTLKASNIISGYLVAWKRSDGDFYLGEEYSFDMTPYDVNITVITNYYIRNGNTIYFGSYPSKLIEDDDIISQLNLMAGKTPTPANLYNWNDYNYYIANEVTSYMYYQDLDIDNDGLNDYRGVYFRQYRPYKCDLSSNIDNSYQDNNGYLVNTIYWFKYEPISWSIINEKSGKAMIIADVIIDTQEYYSSVNDETFEHNDGTGYANNYALSNLRKWLNEKFYTDAFSSLQRSMIKDVEVDNSPASTKRSTNDYSCINTNDKIFLQSYYEYYSNDLPYDFMKNIPSTDYAKAQGLIKENYDTTYYWWLRSPSGSNANNVIIARTSQEAVNNIYGIRPVCYIQL